MAFKPTPDLEFGLENDNRLGTGIPGSGVTRTKG